MPLNASALSTMLNSLGSAVTHVALHSGPSQGEEISGGIYARKAVTWATASAGNLDSDNVPIFDVPGSTTITHVGFWSALTGGTFYGTTPLPQEEVYAVAARYAVDDIDINLTAV